MIQSHKNIDPISGICWLSKFWSNVAKW